MEKGTIVFFIIAVILIIGGIYYLPKFLTKDKTSSQYLDIDDIAETILLSINSGSYSDFSKDLSETTKEAMSQQKFNDMRGLVLVTSGRYIKKAQGVKTMNAGYEIYIYDTEFEKEHVTFSLSFKPGIKKVEGVWLASPNLRG